jgi:DNA-binding NarL/FixJ family response regulator
MRVRIRYPKGTPLSAREVEVVSLVAEGLTNAGVAKRLGLSPLAVKVHLANIGDKLGNGDRAGIVGAAFRSGLMTTARVGADVARGVKS